MTDFAINQTYHGFTLNKIEMIHDIHSTAYLFSHEQSGARLLYLKNSNNNKVFNVAFKTPPSDNCGTPHILEHSVLCGSRKYEAKDPFNELAKGSLNTFLNAMTYADKTMYPIASCNEKDFHNLMDVYLDAVFFPKIYEKKEIFQQEGWRYLLKEDGLEVTGVVYNEMKGALSDPESLLSGVISRSVFGETTYGFESGGDPKAIPDLTYESFLDFHRKYYHPSNAYFYLYGDMEPLSCLQHIQEGFLKEFTSSSALPIISETVCAKKGETIYETYPAAEEGEESGSYLAYALKVGKCTDPERIMALQILSYVLLESNASPLKNALLEEGLCEETEGWFDSSTYEMVFSIIAKNADAGKMEHFIRIIEEVCNSCVANGLPADLLNGALQKYDFLLREEDYGSTPKGLIYCSRLMKRWLHGEDPCESLRLLETMEKLKNSSKTGYFEALLDELFCKNDEKVFIIFTPEKGKSQKEEQLFAERMMKRRDAMTEEDLAEIKRDAEKLEQFQKQEDTPEILSQIPQLALSEISEKPQITKYQTDILANNNPLLFVPMESNGIQYLKLHFDITSVPQELLPYTGLLSDLLGKLDTETYTFQELPNELNTIFGGFSLQNNNYQKDASAYRAFLTVKSKFLQKNTKKAFSLIKEILLHTKFDCVDSLKKIIKSAKIKGENELLNNSHYFAIYHSGSHLFPALQVEDLTSGIEYYRFLCKIDAELEKDPVNIVENLRKTAAFIFRKENLEAACGCEEGTLIKEMLDHFLSELPDGELKREEYYFSLQPKKIAFTSTGGVLYNAASFDAKKSGFGYSGKYQVLKTIVNLEYLWNKIRVQGGAYGCGCNFLRSGFSYFYSYRDPNLAETFDIYQTLSKDIVHFTADEREMSKYILGTINRMDQPKTNMEQLNEAIGRFYKGITDKMLMQERQEILKSTDTDIRNCHELLQQVDCENICSIGDEQKIKKNKHFFTEIHSLI